MRSSGPLGSHMAARPHLAGALPPLHKVQAPAAEVKPMADHTKADKRPHRCFDTLGTNPFAPSWRPEQQVMGNSQHRFRSLNRLCPIMPDSEGTYPGVLYMPADCAKGPMMCTISVMRKSHHAWHGKLPQRPHAVRKPQPGPLSAVVSGLEWFCPVAFWHMQTANIRLSLRVCREGGPTAATPTRRRSLQHPPGGRKAPPKAPPPPPPPPKMGPPTGPSNGALPVGSAAQGPPRPPPPSPAPWEAR